MRHFSCLSGDVFSLHFKDSTPEMALTITTLGSHHVIKKDLEAKIYVIVKQ